ncbi:MAG: resolvase [Synechococcaceae bacterium WB7_3xG_012]|nr:resolvase [Synechococcaceae bacterium WB7_3xG_012]
MTWIGLDPGRSKCGLVRSDQTTGQIEVAAVLSPEECFKQIAIWRERPGLEGVVLGDGTGSKHWQRQLSDLGLAVQVIPEAGTTLAARARYWQLEPPRGWRRMLPEGLRLPPRDYDDVVAQLLLERHWGTELRRAPGLVVLRQLAA